MYPNLDKAKLIALDIETYDPDLKKLGPGPRRNGRILGVAIAVDGVSWYFEDSPELYKWLQIYEDKTYIGANFLYDLDYLQYKGFEPKTVLDVQVAEPLIDENQAHYSLDFLGKKYLQIGKGKDEIQEFCDRHKLKGDPRQHLYKMPVDLVRKYAKIDAELTLKVFEKQIPILKEQDLIHVFDMEMRLFPLYLQMRKTGVRVNRKRLYELDDLYKSILTENQNKLNKLVGFDCNVRSRIDVKKAFDKFGYNYNYNPPTPKMIEAGKDPNPCFNAAFLDSCDHELSKLLRYIAKYRDITSKFTSGLDKFITDGRIHPIFVPIAREKDGTKSGRFSCVRPNLQQQCNADKEFIDGRFFGKEIRGIFIPEDGYLWGCGDYSQIEFRMLGHYATGQGSEDIRDRYTNDPDTDYHQACADLAGISRKESKSINFGLVYGMGIAKLCKSLKLSEEEGRNFIAAYHASIPFLRQTSNSIIRTVKSRGYIKTIMKRRARLKKPDLAYTYVNRLFQGSAADVMKKCMLDAYEAGIFKTLIPHLTIHDELDYSLPPTKEGFEAEQELKYIAENCIKFKVPLKFDLERGPNWGELEKV